ncbi:hypothetical protein AWM70_14690 [Paenibacillus yonginensis]|uniref:Uncharacterized protein n=1 Tax=Paenibacillus yonginensis TaxID=1462996 RepID=A0A1B1N2N5_9BACL|nr:hypothetical protein AWM70_14690 [Paenibacillus yonginensis]
MHIDCRPFPVLLYHRGIIKDSIRLLAISRLRIFVYLIIGTSWRAGKIKSTSYIRSINMGRIQSMIQRILSIIFQGHRSKGLFSLRILRNQDQVYNPGTKLMVDDVSVKAEDLRLHPLYKVQNMESELDSAIELGGFFS